MPPSAAPTARRRARDGGLRAGGVANPLEAELRGEARGGAEGPRARYVLAHLEHRRVAAHLLAHRLVDRAPDARPLALLRLHGPARAEQLPGEPAHRRLPPRGPRPPRGGPGPGPAARTRRRPRFLPRSRLPSARTPPR